MQRVWVSSRKEGPHMQQLTWAGWGIRRRIYIFSPHTRLYIRARVVSIMVKNISSKCLTCLHILIQTCRQVCNPSGQHWRRWGSEKGMILVSECLDNRFLKDKLVFSPSAEEGTLWAESRWSRNSEVGLSQCLKRWSWVWNVGNASCACQKHVLKMLEPIILAMYTF